jgi:hypothetical protein
MHIPFFPNTGDGTHCFQAALRMALAVVIPGRAFSMEELDLISQKQPGMWTWPTAAMFWLLKEGVSLKLIEEFDYTAFAERGEAYLVERFGEEVARAQAEHSDIDREREIARRFAAMAPIEQRVPGINDLCKQVERGAVVIVNLNAAELSGQEGYSGHFVVICEVREKSVVLHDPGLPPRPHLEVPWTAFLAAWSWPSDRERNLLAIGQTGARSGRGGVF